MRTALAAAMLALGGAGCAFTPVHVYPPAAREVSGISTVGRGREIAVQTPFDDERPDRSRCGTQKNSYNTETADVICDLPPTQWVANALVQGLERAGFRVVPFDAPSTPMIVRVHGDLEQFFVEPLPGFFTIDVDADIAVRLVVTSPSGLHAERRFYFKGVKEAVMATESRFEAVSVAATQRAVQTMVRAIVALLDRYPELGKPPPPPSVATEQEPP